MKITIRIFIYLKYFMKQMIKYLKLIKITIMANMRDNNQITQHQTIDKQIIETILKLCL